MVLTRVDEEVAFFFRAPARRRDRTRQIPGWHAVTHNSTGGVRLHTNTGDVGVPTTRIRGLSATAWVD